MIMSSFVYFGAITILYIAWCANDYKRVKKISATEGSISAMVEPNFSGGKMKFCSHCGAEINAAAVVCVKCGCAVANLNPAVVGVVNPNDAPSSGFATLGFFCPWLGLILFLIWNNSSPKKAKSCGKGALIGSIALLVLAVVIFIIGSSSLWW